MTGWVKLHREWKNNATVMKDSDYFSVFIYLMMEATFEEKSEYYGGEKIILKAGQLLICHREIYECLKIEPTKLRRILKLFKNDGLIDYQTDKHKTLITLEFWSDYQGKNDEPNDYQMTDRCRTEQEREKEKEKRSKREKEKEKEIYNKERRKEAPTGRAFYDLRRKGDLSSPPTYGDADEFFALAVARSYEDEDDEPLDTSG